jgi:hypothetical protein
MTETALISVFNGTGCAGFLLKTARGWRAFTSHADCAAKVRLGSEREIGFYPTAAAARDAILAAVEE